MIVGLLGMNQEGLEFDHQRFAEAYQILLERARVPAGQVYAFGEHALEHLPDPAVARKLILMAVEQSRADPELVAAMADALLTTGHPAMANAVADRARALGIADLTMPTAPAPPAANAAGVPGTSP